MINTLTVLRFLAIILIYVHHLGSPLGFGPPAVTFFFILSGFVLALGDQRKFVVIDFQSVRDFFFKRVTKIYPLHIFTLILSIPVIVLTGFQTNIFSVLANIFLLQTSLNIGIQVFAFNGVSWFIADIVIFYLLTPFILHIIRKFTLFKHTAVYIFFALAVYACQILLGLYVGNNVQGFSFGWWLIYISPYSRFLDFIIGLLFGVIFMRFSGNIKPHLGNRLIFTVLEMGSLYLFGWSIFHYVFFQVISFSMGIYYVPFSLLVIFVFAFQTGYISRLLNNRLLVYLGQLSMPIFFIHQVAIGWTAIFFASPIYGSPTSFNHAASQVILFVVILCISDVVARYFLEPAQQIMTSLLNRLIPIRPTLPSFQAYKVKLSDWVESVRPIFISPASLALLTFLIFFISVTIIHENLNKVPAQWDEAMYIGQSEIVYKALQGNDAYTRIYYGIVNNGPGFTARVLSNMMGGYHAPLILLTPMLGYVLLGTGTPAITVTFALLIFIFALVVYYYVAKFLNPWAAFLAVVFTSTMPLTVGLSRMLMVEYGLMILVCLWVFLQKDSNHFAHSRFILPLGTILGLGMLMKVSFPIYIIGPILFGFISTVSRSENWLKNTIRYIRNALGILCVGLVVMGGWYFPNLQTVINFGLNAGFGEASKFYSSGNPFNLSVLTDYWLGFINSAISFYYFALLLVLVSITIIINLVKGKSKHQVETQPTIGKNLGLFLIWFLIPFLILSFSSNKDIRFVLPALPAMGILIAWLVTTIVKPNKWTLVVYALVILFPCGLFTLTTLPVRPATTLNAGPFLIASSNIRYASQPLSQNWKLEKIMNTINEDARKHHLRFNMRQPLLVASIPSLQYFNSNNLLYTAVHNDLAFQVVSPSRPNTPQESEAQIKLMKSVDYIITKTGEMGPSFVINEEITPMLLDGKLPFSVVSRFRLPDNSNVIIFRNNKIE